MMNPLFATVTAQTHLGTLYGLSGIGDYQAGVLYITKEYSKMPDGKDEGLGVRAFAVDEFGLRKLNLAADLVFIEANKHISGETGSDDNTSVSTKGVPYIGEEVKFDFNSAFKVDAPSVEVLLSKYASNYIVDIHIDLTSGGGS